MSLPDKHVDKVCKFGKGAETCSFLALGHDGLSCLKGGSLEGLIRGRRAQKTIRAMGDNCSGSPHFSTTSPDRPANN